MINVGLLGCYVRTGVPLPVETETILHLALGDFEFEPIGKVRFCEPGKGMGVEFTHISPRALMVLHSIVAASLGYEEI